MAELDRVIRVGIEAEGHRVVTDVVITSTSHAFTGVR